ncbi:peptidoglycan DD-metalloendopeptidase family protein [Acinetobacter albensis]|uniref:peptidoglycan DD-metalloendopeptidase family protein n=1 Tax=Acinetobacter TaxID=469 RepID=UPI00187E3348|nr:MULTISPECIES: peptidoglycan DD-metalloendopeptidase family protein [Acinetobacter]MBE9401411.1 peptidoglycan DD-metalloendopeptidase family protein [Acinetobacter albensis]QPF38823.1 peptidoglycan DD-metalloendopeptidase family protein [Acinetobacter sp. TTH0-4]
MHLVSQYRLFSMPTALLKTIVLSTAVISTVVLSGCASKPQINNTTRYATAPDYYTVRSGDTLSAIAARYGLGYVSVAEMNDIASPYRIYVGQSLRLKDTGSRRSSTQAVTQAAPIQRQTVQVPTTLPKTTAPVSSIPVAPVVTSKVSTLRWVKPSNGAVLQNFNLASNVKGIRYGGNVGDAIFAAADGQVVYAADGLKEYGNLILIKHIDGYITAYAHNSKMNVNSGQNVTAGQKIAEMGSSGASRTMLEFQVRLDGKPIDPTKVLPIS